MRILALTAAIVGALASGSAARAQATKITFGYTLVVDYASAFVAKDEGIFDKHGLDVVMQQMPNGNSIPPGLLSGSLQVGGITAPTLIQSKAASFPIKVIAGGSVVTKDNPNGFIAVKAGLEVKEAKDLLGKRVGTGAVGSYFNVLFRQWLINNGVDPDKVTHVEVPFPQMADVMRNGQIDAATLGQPFLARMEAAGVGKQLNAYTATFGDGLLSNIYTVTDMWLASNPSAPAKFRQAIEEANQFIRSNPEKARADIAKYLKLPADAMGSLPLSTYASDVSTAQIKTWSDIMKGQKLIDRDVDPSSVLLK